MRISQRHRGKLSMLQTRNILVLLMSLGTCRTCSCLMGKGERKEKQECAQLHL